eukprot:TRINITY_DN6087_c0_g1_i3.p1 TRINITY_DN6087_c0_g1~~TRINITY_DN6087_c0_g1_i3.p1  ORF type:complete len:384 (+),score=76.47 TRINITY_DN6087_c0_g1_i3:465-1616(+)
MCQLMSWFYFFTGVRTLANSLETVLINAALLYWPWPVPGYDQSKVRARCALGIAAITCCVRPTAPLCFAVPVLVTLIYDKANRGKFVFDALWISFWSASFCIGIDSYFYGTTTFAPYTFLKFNVLTSGSAHFGVHVWHWYLSQGVPAVLTTHLVFVFGVKLSSPAQRPLAWMIAVTVLGYSALGHKEFRFIMPIIPAVCVYCAVLLNYLHQSPKRLYRRLFTVLIVLFVLGNAVAALYTSLIHQRGTTSVMRYLRTVPDSQLTSVDFLMPCYSVPLYAYLHRNVTARLLDCSPPPSQWKAGIVYRDEADRFFDAPSQFTAQRYADATQIPSHIVMYDALQPVLAAQLRQLGFVEVHREFHAHFYGDSRASKYVLVFQRSVDSN